VPATTLEQPVVTQPVPSPAPAPCPALQAAPAVRGPAVPVVAPVGGGAASAVVPAHWRGPLVVQVQDLAEVRCPRFGGDGGGELAVIVCQAGEGCVHRVQPHATFYSRSV